MKVRDIAPFGLRMAPELKRALEEASKKNRRSLNSELVMRLERSLKDDEANEKVAA